MLDADLIKFENDLPTTLRSGRQYVFCYIDKQSINSVIITRTSYLPVVTYIAQTWSLTGMFSREE